MHSFIKVCEGEKDIESKTCQESPCKLGIYIHTTYIHTYIHTIHTCINIIFVIHSHLYTHNGNRCRTNKNLDVVVTL